MRISPDPARARTIQSPVTVKGIGIHTGALSRVTLSPLLDSGGDIIFRSQGTEILADVENVVDTSRCTVLGTNGVTVSTVEHLMAACAGLGINRLLVDIEGAELPIGDGSSLLWNDAIASVGVHNLHVDKVYSPSLPVVVTGKNGAFIAAYPSDKLTLTVAVSFEHPLVGTQVARYNEATDNYFADIAPARTFGFIEEVEALRKAGLALGGSEENAVVVYPDRYSRPLRFPNELARHKLLDLMGDLALAGLPLPSMEIFAVKPSHRLNIEFARALASRG